MQETLELSIVAVVIAASALYLARKFLRGEPACTASDACGKCVESPEPKTGSYSTTPLLTLGHPPGEEPRAGISP